jgi:DNA mismatch repair protein MutL
VLYLEVPLDRVDVNVHPTKHEVRFREARLIHGLITGAIRDCLSEQQVTPAVAPKRPTPASSKVAEHHAAYQAPPLVASTHSLPSMSVQVLADTYGLTMQDNQHWLIDLRLADQTVRQQQFQQSLADNKVTGRPVLVPIDFPASPQQCQAVIEYSELLSACGMQLQPAAQTIQIRQFPALLGAVALRDLLDAVLGVLTAESTVTLPVLQQTLVDLVPAQSQFSQQQAENLLKQLQDLSWQHADWARQLDKSVLADLFSTQTHHNPRR